MIKRINKIGNVHYSLGARCIKQTDQLMIVFSENLRRTES